MVGIYNPSNSVFIFFSCRRLVGGYYRTNRSKTCSTFVSKKSASDHQKWDFKGLTNVCQRGPISYHQSFKLSSFAGPFSTPTFSINTMPVLCFDLIAHVFFSLRQGSLFQMSTSSTLWRYRKKTNWKVFDSRIFSSLFIFVSRKMPVWIPWLRNPEGCRLFCIQQAFGAAFIRWSDETIVKI